MAAAAAMASVAVMAAALCHGKSFKSLLEPRLLKLIEWKVAQNVQSYFSQIFTSLLILGFFEKLCGTYYKRFTIVNYSLKILIGRNDIHHNDI